MEESLQERFLRHKKNNMTQAVAKTNGIRISPRKVRLVADSIRNMSVIDAMQLLSVTPKRGASILQKTLQSAVANALQKGAKSDELFILKLEIQGGTVLQRFHSAARGRARPFTKRSSHVVVTVGNKVTLAKKTEEKKVTETKKGIAK